MKLQTKHLGIIEFDELKKITFEKGIPGFRELHEYIIVADEDEESIFAYLQSIEDGGVSFILANPYGLKPDYVANIKDDYIQQLGGGKEEDFTIFVIATVMEEFATATVNLLAPIVIQNETRKGMQVILENTSYTTRHKIVELLEQRGC